MLFESLFESVHARVVRNARSNCMSLSPGLTSLCFMKQKGDDRPSLSATLIKEQKRHNLSIRENAWLAATM